MTFQSLVTWYNLSASLGSVEREVMSDHISKRSRVLCYEAGEFSGYDRSPFGGPSSMRVSVD
jgi:hypothetical protein